MLIKKYFKEYKKRNGEYADGKFVQQEKKRRQSVKI